MNCNYCHRTEPNDIHALIDAGWIAYYYAGQQEMIGPVCPECCGEYLRQDDNWEWEVVVPEAIAHRYN